MLATEDPEIVEAALDAVVCRLGVNLRGDYPTPPIETSGDGAASGDETKPEVENAPALDVENLKPRSVANEPPPEQGS